MLQCTFYIDSLTSLVMTRQQTHSLYTFLAKRLIERFYSLKYERNVSPRDSCLFCYRVTYQILFLISFTGANIRFLPFTRFASPSTVMVLPSPSHLTAILPLLPYPTTMIPFGKHTQRCATNMTATNNFILDR